MRYLLVPALAILSQAADLASVKTVYLMPMSRGLDQYLAQKLAETNRFIVTTDPTKADAFFSDRIGSGFEDSLHDLLTPKADVEKKDDGANPEYVRPAMQPLSRGKGNVFLIDRQSHSIIWSAYAPSKGTDANDLNRIAAQLANQLTNPPKQRQ